MKKFAAILIAAGLICSLWGCGTGDGSPDIQNSGNSNQTNRANIESGNSGGSSQNAVSAGNLTILNRDDTQYRSCCTSDGYYYLTEDTGQLKDGSYARHLMYMDFASQTEIYLCSNAGCSHDSADCPSVFLYDEFQSEPQIFIDRGQLYILARNYDNEGSMSTIQIGEASSESVPAVLYRADLDGKNREKVYTFDSGLTLESLVLGDGSGLYFITKKLSAQKDGNSAYTTSSEKNLIFLNPETGKETVVCSLNFDDNISWKVQGCFDRTLILYGTDFETDLSLQEQMSLDDDAYMEFYKRSSDVTALLDLASGAKKERYRMSNQDAHSCAFSGHYLYLSEEKSGTIQKIDLTTGNGAVLASLPQNSIYQTFNGMLCCHSWDWTDDSTLYFVNTETGEIRHSSLVNKSLGWSLEFQAELESDFLVIYDYDADALGDGSYEINQYQYALISKEDLYAGRDQFRPIAMIGKGV